MSGAIQQALRLADRVQGFLDLHGRDQVRCRLARVPWDTNGMHALVSLRCGDCGEPVAFLLDVSALSEATRARLSAYGAALWCVGVQ